MEKKLLSKEECKEIELNILKTISNICCENNLKYYMCGGTLLGAVRHKGFIPWDDDIDIMLLRKDYDKLIEILKKQKTYSWLTVLDSKNMDYYYTFAKAIDNRTIAKMDDNITEHGLWVDIFPYDNLPDDVKKRNKFILKGYYYRSIVMAMTTDFNAKTVKKKNIKKILKLYSNFINKDKFIIRYEKFCRKYNDKKTNYVGCLFSPYKLKECFKREWFEKQNIFNFEDELFYGPEEYEKVLTQLYGNYMELPPESKRRNHQIIAWRK